MKFSDESAYFFVAILYFASDRPYARFERELEALRKELAETTASRSGASTPPASLGSPVMHARTNSSYSLVSEDEASLSTAESLLIIAQDIAPSMTPLNALGMDLQSDSETSLESLEKKQQ